MQGGCCFSSTTPFKFSTWTADQCPNSQARKREKRVENGLEGMQGANGKQTNSQVMRELDEGLYTREEWKTRQFEKENHRERILFFRGGGKKKGGHFAVGICLHDFWRKHSLENLLGINNDPLLSKNKTKKNIFIFWLISNSHNSHNTLIPPPQKRKNIDVQTAGVADPVVGNFDSIIAIQKYRGIST